MNSTKYVVLDYQGFDTIFMFPGFIGHSDFVASFINPVVISAGFIEVYDNDAFAYGESVSLGIKARDEDSRLAKRALCLGSEYD